MAADVRAYLAPPAPIVTRAARALALALPAILLGVLLSRLVIAPLLGAWPEVNHHYTAWQMRTFPNFAPISSLDHTAGIAFLNSTDAEALARDAGVEGVSNASVVSHRRLHGALCETLARSGARAVVLDIMFVGEREYDDGLRAGIAALREAGIGVVLAAPEWRLDDRGAPNFSRTLWREGVDWGSYEVSIERGAGLLEAPLIVERDGVAMPALSLAAFAAANAQGDRFSLDLDAGAGEAAINYWRPQPDRSGERVATLPPERIPLDRIERYQPDPEVPGGDFGMRAGDLVGRYRAAPIDREVLAAGTQPYEDVIGADDVRLRQWFLDRIVVVGNASTAGNDLHLFAGEEWPGAYFHTALIESLMRRVRTTSAAPATLAAIEAGAGALGVGVVLLAGPPARSRRRGAARGQLATAGLLIGAGLVIIGGASVLSYKLLGHLWSPIPGAGALVFAAVSFWILRSRAIHGEAARRMRTPAGEPS